MRFDTEMVRPNIEVVKGDMMSLLDRELSMGLCYHNKRHTIDVYESAKRYAELEEIPPSETDCLLAAALFHDAGFTAQYEDNESVGAEIARAMLPKYGYLQQNIDIIAGIILSTKMPQNPQTLLQRVLCDADLDHLGSDDFLEKGDLLRREWEIFLGKKYSDKEWYRFQLRFLEEHKYFTNSARKLRGRGVLNNIRKLKKSIDAL